MTGSQVESVRFVAVGRDDPLAEPLLAELAVEYSSRYDVTEEGTAAWLRSHPAHEFAAPDGALLIGLLDDVPVTGGAFQRLDADTAELKRIWTHSGHRQRGYAKALLIELEALAAERGYRRVYLTTGDRQPEAEALYESAGYTRLTDPLPAEQGERSDGGKQRDIFPIAFQKVLG